MNQSNKSPLVTFFSVIISIALIAVIVIGVRNIAIQMNKSDDKTTEDIADIGEERTTAELTQATVEEASTTEETTEAPNWFVDAHVMEPSKSENTISLPKADLSVFEEDETEVEMGPEAETKGAWEMVTLNLESKEGSINKTSPGEASKTQQLTSTYMILVDLDNEEVVAERDSDKVIYPASMTKILTAITARDYITEENLDDTFTITGDIIDKVNIHGLSAVGFSPGDVVTVRDLLYGTIVCSGGDAAYGLADYCAGSEEAFVEKMNENVEKLGLSETAHFTNPVGNFDEENHCTMRDMSIILSVAMQDDLLKDVLSKRRYTTDSIFPQYPEDSTESSEGETAETTENNENTESTTEATTQSEDGETTEEKKTPEPIEISNWFLRRIEDKEFNGNVIGAKTGFVNQSGFCCASYYEANNGKHYICVTGNAYSSWRAIYDHVGVYRSFTE